MYKVNQRTADSSSTKSLLEKGLIPGIVYGKGTEPTKIVFEEKILKKIMLSGVFYSKILDLDIEGKKEKVLPKALQYHPVTDKLIHFDFLRVQENTKVTVEVPVEYLNQDICPGLKQGGVLNLVRRSIELICNANNIPEKLQFDLFESDIGDTVKISNIELPENVTLTITDRDFVVATLVPPTIEVEPEPTEEEAAEGEEMEGDGEEVAKDETKEETKTEDKKEESVDVKDKKDK